MNKINKHIIKKRNNNLGNNGAKYIGESMKELKNLKQFNLKLG